MTLLSARGLLFAADSTARISSMQEGLALAAALVMGASIAWLFWRLACICEDSTSRLVPSWRYDDHRRLKISRKDRVFRRFNPLVEDLQDSRLLHTIGRVEQVRNRLKSGSERVSWTAEEFLAATATRSLLIGGGIALVMTMRMGMIQAAILGMIVAVIAFYRALRALRKRTARRRGEFLRGLSFAIDLMAMTMEAGAGFRESLEAVVRHNNSGAVREEFGELLRELNHGQPLAEALNHLQERMPDDEVKEIVFAVLKADEFGTPLRETFLRLAEQMRIRRSQRVERAAGRANANVTFPGLVTMLACILLIVGPFVINAISQTQTAF